MKKFKIAIWLLLFLIFSTARGTPEDRTDLRSAFDSLKRSMGTPAAPESDAEVDRVLGEATEEIPDLLQHSSVALESLTIEKANAAIASLAGASTTGALDVSVKSQGPLVTLALWSGSRASIEKVVKKVLNQLYTEGDNKKFQIVLSSSPMPTLSAEPVDLNQRIREMEWLHYAAGLNSDVSQWEVNRLKANFSYRTPKDPAYIITLTAGLFANLENLDELAGQIALKLALSNPTSFGFKDDPRFKRNKDILEMIDKAIREDWTERNQAFLKQKRAEIEAEFSAIERMNQANFNPMAMADFEERVHGWISDIFMKRKIHFLTRKASKIKDYEFADWTRPMRLQAQEDYVLELQGSERGRTMNQKYTEFPKELRSLRLRLSLFTKWFFAGSLKQIAPVALISGATLTHIFAPEISHAVLSSLAATSGEAVRALIAHPPVAQGLDYLGKYVDMSLIASQELLDAVYASLPFEMLKEDVRELWKVFSEKFDSALVVGGITISSAILLKNYSEILRFFEIVVRGPPEARFPTIAPGLAKGSKIDSASGGSLNLSIPKSDGPSDNSPGLSESDFKAALGVEAIRAGWGYRFGSRVRGLLRKYVLRDKDDQQIGEGLSVEIADSDLETREERSIREMTAAGFSRWGARARRVAQRTNKWLRPVAATSGKHFVSFVKLGPRAVKSTFSLGGYLVFRAPVELRDFGMNQAEDLRNAIEKRRRQNKEKLQLREIMKAKLDKDKSWMIQIMEGSETSESEVLKLFEEMLKAANMFKDGYGDSSADIRDLAKFGMRINGRQSGFKPIQRALLIDDVEAIFRVVEKWSKVVDVNRSNDSSVRQLKITSLLEIAYQRALLSESSKLLFMQRLQAYLPLIEKLKDTGIREEVALAKAGKGLEFLRDAYGSYAALNSKDVDSGKVIVNSFLGTQYFKGEVFEKLIQGNELKVLTYLTGSECSEEEFIKFFELAFKFYGHQFADAVPRNRMKIAVGKLNVAQRLRLFTLGNRMSARIKWLGKKQTMTFESIFAPLFQEQPLQKAIEEVVASLVKSSSSITELNRHVEDFAKQNRLSPLDLQSSLSRIPIENSALLQNFQELELIISQPQYWSETRNAESQSPIEQPLLELLKASRVQNGSQNSAMNYDPIMADRSHRALQNRLIELGLYPKDYNGLRNLFLMLTSRGVSIITDDILAGLLANGSPEQIHDLRENAVKQGRVFDQGLRDEFAIRQLLESEEYRKLLSLKKVDVDERQAALQSVLKLAQELMSDLGHRYVQFTEELSAVIQASYIEAKTIYEARAKRLIATRRSVDLETDNRLAALQRIIPYIKEWKEKDQFEFLLYLREGTNTPASKFIESQFPTFGPERVRRMYQELPLQSAMSLVDIYLKETLLARKSVQEGYGGQLISYLVSNETDEDTRKYGTLLLEGLLEGLRTRSSKRYQTRVLSALVAMRSDNSRSVGETLKVILEQFPGVGPKIGQFLVGVGILPFEINEVLKTTQDATLPPKYFEMYSDLKSIVGRGDDIGIDLIGLLGSGSLKYSVEGVDRTSGEHVALQIFREDVQNNSEFQIGILEGMIEYLVRVGGREWAYLQVIVDGAANAVKREKRVLREAGKTALARRIYAKFSDEQFQMQVPEQQLINNRLLVSRFAKGTSFKKLANEDKVATGLKILAVEADILFQNDRDVIWYDADRHAGNYLIDVKGQGPQKTYSISPIDFGQLTYIRKSQRDRLIELFALAGILGKVGANDWLATKISEVISLNSKQKKKLQEILPLYFKLSKKNQNALVVTHYFNLIAAINESVKSSPTSEWTGDVRTGKLDFAYTDFVRALIQLNQYESEIAAIRLGLPKETKSPSLILESRAKDKIAEYVKIMDFSLKQKTIFAGINSLKWFDAKRKSTAYQPLNVRPSRSDLDTIAVMNRNQNFAGPLVPVVPTTLQWDLQNSRPKSCSILFSLK